MAVSDETIALAIPPELKTDHPDSALVVQALAVALAACEDSGALSAKGRMRDVRAALSGVYVPIFQAHIAKEDEDWGALNDRVKMAESPPVAINTGEPEDVGDAFQWKGRASDGTFWIVQLAKESGETVARVFSEDRNSRLASAEGSTPVLALVNAYKATGKRAEVSVPEPAPIPEPAPAPEPTPEPAEDDSEDEGGNPFILHVNPTPGKECPVCGIGKVVRVEHKAVRGADGSITGYLKTVNTSIKSSGGFIRDSYLEPVEKNGRTAWYNATHAKKDGGA